MCSRARFRVGDSVEFCGGGGFGVLLRRVSWFLFGFLDPLDLFLLGKKRFWTRALRSTLGVCGVLVYTLRSFGGVRCWVNTSRSFGGVRLLV
jgi:hypothetical protein